MALIALKINVLNAHLIHSCLCIMDGKTMHYAETKMTQVSLQMWSRRVREKCYSSFIKFQLIFIFIRESYRIRGKGRHSGDCHWLKGT